MSDALQAADPNTLFGVIVSVTGLSPEDDENPDEFKGRVVRYFNDLSDDDYDKAMENRDELAVWIKSATEVYRDNRSSRLKAPLPVLTGLDLPADTNQPAAEVAPKRRRGRPSKTASASADGAAPPQVRKTRRVKAVREDGKRGGRSRDPSANRFFVIGELMVENPKLAFDQLVEKGKASNLDYKERTYRRVYDAWKGVTHALQQRGKLKTPEVEEADAA